MKSQTELLHHERAYAFVGEVRGAKLNLPGVTVQVGVVDKAAAITNQLAVAREEHIPNLTLSEANRAAEFYIRVAALADMYDGRTALETQVCCIVIAPKRLQSPIVGQLITLASDPQISGVVAKDSLSARQNRGGEVISSVVVRFR